MQCPNWWKKCNHILEFDGDGQRYKRVYTRQKRAWEYVIVTFSDDGIPLEVMTFAQGFCYHWEV